MSLRTGKSPASLQDSTIPDEWTASDLAILSKWQHMQSVKCPGCGRPLSQHIHNPFLEREELPSDYEVYSYECPSEKAIGDCQEAWREQNKTAIDRFYKGEGSDPGTGLYWMSQGSGETLPIPTTD